MFTLRTSGQRRCPRESDADNGAIGQEDRTSRLRNPGKSYFVFCELLMTTSVV
jgi:hypothetical protein